MRLERVLAWSAASLALVAPLAIGSVHRSTQLLLSLGGFAIAACLILIVRRREGIRLGSFAVPALLAVAFTVLQLTPLPAAILRALSPHAAELRADVGQSWAPITLDVPATVFEVVKGFLYLGILVVVVGTVRSERRARRVLLCVAAAGTLVALLAIVQRLTGAQTILGFYRPRSPPGSGLWGSFVNGNHAASLFALSALTAAGLALQAGRTGRFAAGIAASVCVVTLLWTGSRAGALGLMCGAFLLMTAAGARQIGTARAAMAALVLVIALGAGGLWMADGLRSRLVPANATVLIDNQKTRGWSDTLRLARDFPLVGVGRGAVEAPLAAYRTDNEGVRLVYPENLLLQLASEWGVLFAIVVLGLCAMYVVPLWRQAGRLGLPEVGAAAGVFAVLVHELADFGLELPGVAVPTVVALGVVIARIEDRKASPEGRTLRAPRMAGVACLTTWAAALAAGAWAAPRQLDADTRRIEDAVKGGATRTEVQALLNAAIARHPADGHIELMAANQSLRYRDPDALKHINRALRLDPSNGHTHRLAARALAAAGYRAQAAIEYRLAAQQNVYVELDELLRVVGDHIVDAVPQEPVRELDLARSLAGKKLAATADLACLRAIDLGEGAERWLAGRVEVALMSGDRKRVAETTRELLSGTVQPASFALAARALEQTGDAPTADEAINRGMKAHPQDGSLPLSGARMRVARGDLAGARSLLRNTAGRLYTLAERQETEEMLAEIADKEHDPDAAMVARARASLLARKRRESQ